MQDVARYVDLLTLNGQSRGTNGRQGEMGSRFALDWRLANSRSGLGGGCTTDESERLHALSWGSAAVFVF